MKKALASMVFACSLISAVWADTADQAIGYWKSVSDVKGEEGKVTALWKFSLRSDGSLFGEVVASPHMDQNPMYETDKPEFQGKPILGYPWVSGLRKNGSDSWGGGQIVDISNRKGDVYGCEIKVVSNGKKLEVRGYLGISLFGRTQTWIAATNAEIADLRSLFKDQSR